MLYRKMGKTGDSVSILGYGCMRFPKNKGVIDEKRTEKQVALAMEQGVNYFDTAYLYLNSESTLGKILSKGYRDKVFIATKMPPIMVHSKKDMESILGVQLKRLRTDYIDYYLIHAINSLDGWQRLKELGIEEFLEKAKKSGKIRHVGFSYHGESNQFNHLIDDYPWDFCQIQYNYMDENIQAGKKGLVYAASKGLGVSVMGPLRGSMLTKMNPQVQAVFNQAGVKRTLAEWALRWIWNHPEVSVVLSGMNEESQIKENVRAASSAYPHALSDKELNCINKAKDILSEKLKVPCTGCGYCMPCPFGVNIAMSFSYYNDKHLYGNKSPQRSYLGMLSGMDGGTPSYASLCRDCGKCEKHCPQGISIPKDLKKVAKDMEPFYFKPAVGLVRFYYKIKNRGKLFSK